jgi:5-formyltetrahydrofolate cyclo-ligase
MLISKLKNTIRIVEKCKREALSLGKKTACDRIMFNKIISLEQYIGSSIILTYVAYKGEPDTTLLIRHSLQMGKTVAVPICITNNGTLEFYIITDLNQLSLGNFGLLEPDVSKCEKLKNIVNGFCVVPGLCFDIYGNRIGYGKGFYDRFLQHFNGFKVGLCFSQALYTEKLPCESFDIPCDAVITEKKTYFVK